MATDIDHPRKVGLPLPVSAADAALVGATTRSWQLGDKGATAVVVIAILASGLSIAAHHSFAADYFEDQSRSIEGEVQDFGAAKGEYLVRLSESGSDLAGMGARVKDTTIDASKFKPSYLPWLAAKSADARPTKASRGR
jgi:hypothetical protein